MLQVFLCVKQIWIIIIWNILPFWNLFCANTNLFLWYINRYRVIKWNLNKVWLYYSVYGAVLELKDMSIYQWCWDIWNLSVQNFRKFNFVFQIQVCLNQLKINLQRNCFCINLHNLIFALISRHFILLSQYFMTWLKMYKINKIFENKF